MTYETFEKLKSTKLMSFVAFMKSHEHENIFGKNDTVSDVENCELGAFAKIIFLLSIQIRRS